MAITNAQQYKQVLQKEREKKAFGGVMSLDGRRAYVGGSYGASSGGGYQGNSGASGSSSTSSGQGPAGGASAGGNYGGNVNTQQTYAGRTYSNQNYATQRSIDRATQAAKQRAAAAKARAAQIAKEKAAEKAAEAKQEKKDAKAKIKRDKKTKQIRTKAFKEFQKLDPYAVEEMGMYGFTPEQIAAGKHLGPVDLGTKKSALGKDSIYDDGQANELEVLGNIAGYDLTGLPMGRTTLTSNKGTSLEKTRPNPYGLRTKTGIPSIDFLGGFMNPDDQIGAINTLNDARNIQDFAGRFADGDDSAYEEYEDYISRNTPTSTGGGGGENQEQTDPCLGPNPPAYCSVGSDDDTEEEVVPNRNLGGLAPRIAGSIFDFTGLADGGRAGAMDGGRMMMMANEEEDDPEGGIMDLESGRQMYFLGKLVKKAAKAVKKVAKSPLGKAALLYGLGSLGAGALGKANTGTGFFSGLKGKLFGTAAGKGYSMPGRGIFNKATEGLLGKLGITKGGGSYMPTAFGGILGATTLTGLMTPKEEDDDSAYKKYMEDMKLDIPALRGRRNLAAAFDGSTYDYEAYADGGRINYAEGSEEPVAKKTMPLLDMDGQEMDLREEGGFVPLGRMERADDVPARLSKNEFVFTADAVRNAGEGDIDKGAEVMYNMMKNLESGGEVSEESQGLEGAREMFQTSQRLEEVI